LETQDSAAKHVYEIMQLLQRNNTIESKTWCLATRGQDKNGWRLMTLHNTLPWIIPEWEDDVPYTTRNCRLLHNHGGEKISTKS